LEEGTPLLTPHAFEFVLDAELKRALRSQNFLTLIVVEAKREWDGLTVTADDGTVGDVARILRHEVRDTDVVGAGDHGSFAMVLLDADYESSTKVIDRLVQRIDNYEFPSPLRISVGAACYPTHAVDARSLKKKALAQPVVNWRGGPSPDTRH
jgi:diguanylate cyclase (GGDEF)-like protein